MEGDEAHSPDHKAWFSSWGRGGWGQKFFKASPSLLAPLLLVKTDHAQPWAGEQRRAITMDDVSSLDLKTGKIKIKPKPSQAKLSPGHLVAGTQTSEGMAGESGSAGMRKCNCYFCVRIHIKPSHKPSVNREHFKWGTELLWTEVFIPLFSKCILTTQNSFSWLGKSFKKQVFLAKGVKGRK